MILHTGEEQFVHCRDLVMILNVRTALAGNQFPDGIKSLVITDSGDIESILDTRTLVKRQAEGLAGGDL